MALTSNFKQRFCKFKLYLSARDTLLVATLSIFLSGCSTLPVLDFSMPGSKEYSKKNSEQVEINQKERSAYVKKTLSSPERKPYFKKLDKALSDDILVIEIAPGAESATAR